MMPGEDTLLRDRYRIISLLGHGGMGAVHLAYDTALDIQVAIKSNRIAESSGQQQFLREARLLATLKHPNLPRVIDYFIDQDTQYLVMDYIPGRDLETLIAEEGIPPLNRVLDWTSQLVSALNYLHGQNPPVIHRDIKPANVKITPDGQAILVDFGLAKASDPTQATAAGATGYTPGYAPPEQYGGSRTGPYTDQYSLAATLYKLMTNQKPVESIKRLLGEAVLTPLQGLNPSVPLHVQNVIEKAMSLQPDQRFASLQEFLDALKNPGYQVTSQPTQIFGDKTVATSAQNIIDRTVARPVATVTGKTSPRTTPPMTETIARPGIAPEPALAAKSNKRLVFIILGIAAVAVFLSLAGLGIWYFVIRENDGGIVSGGKATFTPQIPAIVEQTTSVPETDAPAQEPSATQTIPAAAVSTETPTATFLPTETAGPTMTPTPRFLVDESRIVFVSDRADGSTLQIWSIQAGQTYDNRIIAMDPQQLTFNPGNKTEPEWSPDGSKIVFTAPGSKGDNTQIWVLDLSVEGGLPVQITDLDGNNMNPTWSSDGSLIAFANYGRYTDVYAMYVMDADGKNLKRLSVDYQETDPKWTPDMQWLLYVIHANSHEFFFWRNKTGDYATPEPFDPTSHFGRMGEVDDPALNADGTYLAFTRMDGNRRQIWSVEFVSRGASQLLLTEGFFTESQPSWSPDGQWIVFTSERDGSQEIYVMTSVGLLQTNLSQSAGIDMQPDWFHPRQ